MKTTPLQRISKLISRSNDLLACNIYVSAGERPYAEPLLSLLHATQEKCREIRLGDRGSLNTDSSSELNDTLRQIAVVHAYADGSYNRSSFHIAGTAECVVHVATHIALGAIDALVSLSTQKQRDADTATMSKSSSNQHPLVGLVDHISVMPLAYEESSYDHSGDFHEVRNSGISNPGNDHAMSANDNEHDFFIPPDIQGMVAVSIAEKLSRRGVNVIPYASADPENTPLSIVRKEKTAFFRSGGLSDGLNMKGEQRDNLSLGTCTIGSPPSFVENYNVRLTNTVSKKEAMRLTRKVRERDGGIVGVEALTLPYSENRYEVACNLLRPNIGTANDILKKVDEWVAEEKRNKIDMKDFGRDNFVDSTYRVGTTVQQCKDALLEDDLDKAQDDNNLSNHDCTVTRRFRSNFLS